MQEEQLYRLLDQLPGYEYEPRSDGEWVSVPCVMAPVRHASGQDRNPSMSISVGSEPSVAFCHACGYSRQFQNSLVDMFRERVYPDIGFLALEAQRIERANQDNPFETFGQPKVRKARIKDTDFTQALSEISGQPWNSAASDFLATKNVSVSTAKTFGCEFLPAGFEHESFVNKEGEVEPLWSDGILLPTIIRVGKDLKCVGAQFRPLITRGMKYLTPWRYSSSYFFFGQQYSNFMEQRPVALVEGAFDVMHLFQERMPSLALNGLTLKEMRIELLTSFKASTNILLLDPDGPGQEAQERLVHTLDKAGVPNVSVHCKQDPKYLNKQQLAKLHPVFAAHYS